MIVIDAIQLLFAGIKVGFQAFFSVLFLYQQISDLKTTIIAVTLGVPTIAVTIISFVVGIVRIYKR